MGVPLELSVAVLALVFKRRMRLPHVDSKPYLFFKLLATLGAFVSRLSGCMLYRIALTVCEGK